MSAQFTPRRTRFSVEQFLRMAGAGILLPEARVELLDGELIDMAPVGHPHAYAVNALVDTLVRDPGLGDVVVWCQSGLQLGADTQLQPDVALLRGPRRAYAGRNPRATDALLVIEVAESSLAYDLHVKPALYARAGIAELWVLDLKSRALQVFRAPEGSRYAGISTPRAGDLLAPLALPGLRVAWSQALPTN